jgi:hypothetical protein
VRWFASAHWRRSVSFTACPPHHRLQNEPLYTLWKHLGVLVIPGRETVRCPVDVDGTIVMIPRRYKNYRYDGGTKASAMVCKCPLAEIHQLHSLSPHHRLQYEPQCAVSGSASVLSNATGCSAQLWKHLGALVIPETRRDG